MSDLLFQQLSTVAGAQTPNPLTIASTTAAIAPTTFLTFISGTSPIKTITPFVNGWHVLCLVFTNGSPGIIDTTGNIVRSSTLTKQNIPYFFVYDPIGAKYYVEIPA